MKRRMLVEAGAVVSLLAMLAAGKDPVYAQVFNDKPLTEKWWPSDFGADDRASAINRITPDDRASRR